MVGPTAPLRSPVSKVVGLAVLSGSLLMLAVALARVLAIMMWQPFNDMVVCVALLGFGAAGSLLTVRGVRTAASVAHRGGGAGQAAGQAARTDGGVTRDGGTVARLDSVAATTAGRALRSDHGARALTWCSLGFAVSVVLSFAIVTRMDVDHLGVPDVVGNVGKAGVFGLLSLGPSLVLSAPFLLGGLAVGLALTRHAPDVPRLHGLHLLGASAGAVVSVVLLAGFGATSTVLFAAVGGLIAAACFARSAGPQLRSGAWLAALIGVALWSMSVGAWPSLGSGPVRWPITFAPGKQMASLPEGMAVRRLPSVIAEVEVTDPFDALPGMGGDISYRGRHAVPVRLATQDGTAPTLLYEGAAHVEAFPFLHHAQAASAYVALEARGDRAERVAVLGVGGGADVMLALAHDAGSVTAVEPNDATIRMVSQDYDAYLGGLFHPGGHALSERVSLVHAEGRAWLRENDQRFDVIQLSGSDALTPLAAGGYALTESYLYTVGAMANLFERLAPDGMVSISRMLLSHPSKPRETLRLAHTALVALEQLGLPDPAAHLVIFRGRHWASTMIKQSPFTAVEINGLRDFAELEGFAGLVFDPLHEPGDTFDRDSAGQVARLQRETMNRAMIELMSRSATAAQHELVVDELLPILAARVAGDRQAVERLELAFLSAASGREDALPLTRQERFAIGRWARNAFNSAMWELSEEAVALAHTRADFETLLRGDATARAAFVAGHAHDLNPSTDDRPYFFDSSRWSASAGDRADSAESGEAVSQPALPLGQRLLWASLGQITLLSFLAIVLPVWRLGRRGVARPGAGRLFGYFAALGVGFLLIEMPMMQKLVVFLGHPALGLPVVLATMLGCAGLGSLSSAKLDPARPSSYRWLGGAIVVLLLVCTLATRFLLPELLGLSLPARVAVTVWLLAPLSFVLGMPLPLGLRAVQQRCPALTPWCWAITGLLSVCASLVAVVLSMMLGFAAVFVVAAAVYVLGFAVMGSWVRTGFVVVPGSRGS